MISPPSVFIGSISSREIEEAAETYGYEGYIPYGFIKDLLYCWTNLVVYEDFAAGIKVNNDYDREFKKLVSLISADPHFYKNGKAFAFAILRIYSGRLDLRQMEMKRRKGKAFTLEEDVQFNYDIDLQRVDPEIMDLLDIDNDDRSPNEIELSPEVLDILRFLDGLKELPGVLEEVPKIIRERMKNYSQIVKIPKHRLVYPTFKYDYTVKSLRAKIPIVERKDRTRVVLVVDASFSTKDESKYLLVYKAILLNYYTMFKSGITTIDLHFVVDRPKYFKVIETKEDLARLFNTPLKLHHSLENWQKSYRYLEDKYEGEHIIFLTDGSGDSLVSHKSPVNSWNIIAFHHNDSLRKLCKKTGGKFIKI